MEIREDPIAKAYFSICHRIGQPYDLSIVKGLQTLIPASFIEIPFDTPGHAKKFAQEFHRSCHEFGIDAQSRNEVVFVRKKVV